jgi:Fe2+ or Zn2+ uptake regulation protein
MFFLIWNAWRTLLDLSTHNLILLVDTKCGRILDPELEGLAAVSAAMARQTGYRITHHQLNFFGLCPKCRKEEQ